MFRHLYGKVRTMRRLGRDGIAALEFALIAPVVMLMLMGVIEFSMIGFVQSVMESATFNASRLGKTGYNTTGVSRTQTIINMINQRTAGLLDPTMISVSSTAYGQFGSVGLNESYTDTNANGRYDAGEAYVDANANGVADIGTSGYGNTGEVVLYTISYPWPIYTPFIGAFFGNNSTVTISTRAVVKNEPW